VVARLNLLRFKPSGTFDFDETVDKMIASAGKFDMASVKKEDLAKMGGAPPRAAGTSSAAGLARSPSSLPASAFPSLVQRGSFTACCSRG
jgi:hypothetical protein